MASDASYDDARCIYTREARELDDEYVFSERMYAQSHILTGI